MTEEKCKGCKIDLLPGEEYKDADGNKYCERCKDNFETFTDVEYTI